MKRLPRRALVALSLCLSFVAGAAVPADASYFAPSDAVRAANRPRAGASVWVPRKVTFNSGWDSGVNNPYMNFSFEWHQNEHMEQLEGSSQFIEISAEVDCSWARVMDDGMNFSDGDQGYHPLGFWTNIPAAALPYEDTIYGEPCVGSNSGRGDFGFGVLNAQALVPGTTYEITVILDETLNNLPPASQSPVKLRVGTGTVYDSTALLPTYLNNDCNFTDTEIANWMAQTETGLQKRLEASWCAWQDWNHVIVKEDGGLTTGEYEEFYPNKLVNQGMEEPGTNGYGFWPAGNQAQYCNGGSFDGNCHLAWNGPGNSIYQDRPANIKAGDGATAEAALKCHKGAGQSCQVMMSFVGLGVSSTEQKIGNVLVPDDGHWYICRIDYDHAGGDNFTGAHDTLRFQIWNNNSYVNMSIDYTFIAAGKTNRDDPSPGGNPGGVGDIPVGPECTRRFS